MTVDIFKVLVPVLIAACLFGPDESAYGNRFLICRHKDQGNKVIQTCQTDVLNEQESEVLCENRVSVPAVHHRYVCTMTARDWAQPSPYAHTSRVRQCTSGDSRTLLFDQDFSDDAVRCHLICGRCETGWQPKKSDH
jgi:hypothetical protein